MSLEEPGGLRHPAHLFQVCLILEARTAVDSPQDLRTPLVADSHLPEVFKFGNRRGLLTRGASSVKQEFIKVVFQFDIRGIMPEIKSTFVHHDSCLDLPESSSAMGAPEQCWGSLSTIDCGSPKLSVIAIVLGVNNLGG